MRHSTPRYYRDTGTKLELRCMYFGTLALWHFGSHVLEHVSGVVSSHTWPHHRHTPHRIKHLVMSVPSSLRLPQDVMPQPTQPALWRRARVLIPVPIVFFAGAISATNMPLALWGIDPLPPIVNHFLAATNSPLGKGPMTDYLGDFGETICGFPLQYSTCRVSTHRYTVDQRQHVHMTRRWTFVHENAAHRRWAYGDDP